MDFQNKWRKLVYRLHGNFQVMLNQLIHMENEH